MDSLLTPVKRNGLSFIASTALEDSWFRNIWPKLNCVYLYVKGLDGIYQCQFSLFLEKNFGKNL